MTKLFHCKMEGFKIRISALYLSINFFSLTPNFGLGLGCLTGNFSLLCLCNQRTTIKFILSWNCEEWKVTTWKESVKLCAVFLWAVYFVMTAFLHLFLLMYAGLIRWTNHYIQKLEGWCSRWAGRSKCSRSMCLCKW